MGTPALQAHDREPDGASQEAALAGGHAERPAAPAALEARAILAGGVPVIAALLTVIGYSMNDTVVVFDRMRENFRKYKQMPPGEVIDLSINETLSRTLMAIGTVLIASLALYFCGGETMRAFAICMLFGTVVATYSSIYIAAPALPMFGDRPGPPAKPRSGLMARGGASE